MLKGESDYKKVEAAIQKSPDKFMRDIFKETGVDPSVYYRHKRNLKPKRRTKGYVRLKAKDATPETSPPPKSDQRLVFMMGTPEQIRAVLAGGGL